MAFNFSGVYSIYNKISKTIYVGSSIKISRRFNEHRKLLRRGSHFNGHLQNSWNKYGEAAFIFTYLQRVGNLTQLTTIEQLWLNKLKLRLSCFNLSEIVDNTFLGKKHSKASKRKISEAAKKRTGPKNHWYGKRLPAAALDAAAEYCRKHFKGEGNPFFGKKHSEATKKLLSAKLKGRKMPESFWINRKPNKNAGKKYLIKLPSGKTIAVINLTNFCKKNNLFPSSAFTAMKNKKSYRGFTFASLENSSQANGTETH